VCRVHHTQTRLLCEPCLVLGNELDGVRLLGVLPLLLGLDGGDDAPRRAPRADDVLVRHGQQVPLLHGQLRRVGCQPHVNGSRSAAQL
jgi:hypothetical protein